MNNDVVLRAFNQVEVSEQNLDQVLGITEIDASLLGMVLGGEGWWGRYYSISGECQGFSCNPYNINF